jgi:hypothetical protein
MPKTPTSTPPGPANEAGAASAAPARRRRPRTRGITAKIAIASLAGAALITGGLSMQMAAGKDPVLGSRGATVTRVHGSQAAARPGAVRTRPVVTRTSGGGTVTVAQAPVSAPGAAVSAAAP